MDISPAEISGILKSQIENFGVEAEVSDVGQVLSVGDGIARIYGLDSVQAGEMVEFDGGIKGMALNLEQDNVGVVIFGSDRDIKEGDTMLGLGAAGGVGLSAVELGKAYGARVVAAVSSEEKAEVARKAGADEVVIYPRAPFDKDTSKALAKAFKEAVGPDGADIVYDIVGGDYSEPALRAIAWEGRFLVVGFPAGIAKMPLNLTLLKSCDIRGVFWGAFTMREPRKNEGNIAELFRLWKDGKINPLVSETYPLERAHEAIAKLESRGAIGKLVVTMDS